MTTNTVTKSRYDTLQEYISVTMEKLEKGFKLSMFCDDMPIVLKKDKSALSTLHSQFVSQVVKNIRINIGNTVEELDLEEKFNTLDNIISKCPYNKQHVAWRPVLGDIESNQAAHDKIVFDEETLRLQEILKKMHLEKKELDNEIRSLEDEIKLNDSKIEKGIKKAAGI